MECKGELSIKLATYLPFTGTRVFRLNCIFESFRLIFSNLGLIITTMAGGTQDAQKDNVVQFLVPSETRVRLEIDEFLADNELTNLLLLALSEIQKEPSKAELEKRKLEEDWWTAYSLSSEYLLTFKQLIFAH